MSRRAPAVTPRVVWIAMALAASAAFGALGAEQRASAPSQAFQGAAEGLIVLGDAGLQQVVVVDARARMLILYAISGTSTRPIVVRDLDADLVSGADVMPVPDLPSADVPGTDLDDVPRPADSVRIGFSHDAGAGASGTWTADYVIRAAPGDAYEQVRSSLEDWKLVSERVSTTSRVAGTMQFESGPRRLTVVLRGYQPGYVRVTFQLQVP